MEGAGVVSKNTIGANSWGISLIPGCDLIEPRGAKTYLLHNSGVLVNSRRAGGGRSSYIQSCAWLYSAAA